MADPYLERRRRFEQDVERFGRRSRLVSNLRGLSFGTMVIAGLIAVFGGSSSVASWLAAAAAVAFVILVSVHARVKIGRAHV